MPTPQAYAELWDEYQELKRVAFNYLTSTSQMDGDREALWDLVGDYEPTEAEQGLIPIPDGYAEG